MSRTTVKNLQNQIDLLRNQLDETKKQKDAIIADLKLKLIVETNIKNDLLQTNINLSNTITKLTNKFINEIN